MEADRSGREKAGRLSQGAQEEALSNAQSEGHSQGQRGRRVERRRPSLLTLTPTVKSHRMETQVSEASLKRSVMIDKAGSLARRRAPVTCAKQARVEENENNLQKRFRFVFNTLLCDLVSG